MVSPDLVKELRLLIQERRVGAGVELLEQHKEEFEKIQPDESGSGFAVGCLAQWVDAGFAGAMLLFTLLQRFDKSSRQSLCLNDYVHLRMAEALAAMRTENLTDAMHHLEAALAILSDLEDARLRAVAMLWRARCLRKAGEYDQALAITREGVELAARTGLPYLRAVIQTLESWLHFQNGEMKQAIRILQEAEGVLRDTDDFITLGNIQSTYGRIALREGRYDHAMRYFEASIDLFQRRPSLEGYLARSLSNIAQAKRFLALQLRRSIDAQRAKNSSANPQRGRLGYEDKASQLERMHDLLVRAQADLAHADSIYKRTGNHHGAGNVDVGLAQIHLDLGKFEEAEQRAREAFELGAKKTDYLLMCRARLVQALIANARFEEEIGEGDDPSRYAQRAHDCAKEAIDLGEHTESRRLLAQAYICKGITLVNGFFNDTEQARGCCDRAETYLGQDRRDALWQELEMLRAKIARAGIEDPNLRAWSQGAVGDKSLQDVVGEFEELLIRNVWEREGRKVSRVAQKLAVSPKKVRRALRHLGLLKESA